MPAIPMNLPPSFRLSPPRRTIPASKAVAAVAALIFAQGVLAGAVQAQTTFYWGGGSGNWDTTTTDWQTAPTGGTATAFVSSPTSIARIGDIGAAGTLTLTTAITAQELDLDLTGFTIAGASPLTLNTGNINSNFTAGNTATSITTVISAPLAGGDINVSGSGTAGSATGTGNDTVTLSGANTFTGNLNIGPAAQGVTTVGVNRVNITAAGALPTTATVRFLNTSSSFAVTTGTLALPNNFVLNPGNTAGPFVSYIGATSGNGLTVNGTISGAGSVTYAAGINGGAGVVLLNSANTYTGGTTLTNSATGIVRLGVTNALPATALVFGDGSTNSAGTTGTTFGALDLNGKNQTVASLATNLAVVGGTVTTAGTATGIINSVAGTTSTLTIAGSGATSYNSTIGTTANPNIALTLATNNTTVQTLAAASVYSGGTTISGGKLRITNTTGSATGTGIVTLNGGTTTTLSGTGSSSGMLTVTAGSRLAPGVNIGGTNGNFGSAGTLTLGSTGGITLNNANLDFDLANTAATAGGGTNDLLATGGALSLGSTLGVTINELNGALISGTAYTLISGATSLTGGLPTITTAYVGGASYTAAYSLNGNNLQVTFSPVPEPSTWAAMLLGLGVLTGALRRRGAAGRPLHDRA